MWRSFKFERTLRQCSSPAAAIVESKATASNRDWLQYTASTTQCRLGQRSHRPRSASAVPTAGRERCRRVDALTAKSLNESGKCRRPRRRQLFPGAITPEWKRISSVLRALGVRSLSLHPTKAGSITMVSRSWSCMATKSTTCSLFD